jgi:hypothetical protein
MSRPNVSNPPKFGLGIDHACRRGDDRHEPSIRYRLALRPVRLESSFEMADLARMPRCRDLARWLLLAGAFTCGLGYRGVEASSISDGPGHASDEHARFCKCRNCDRESCCCGPRKAKAPTSRAASTSKSSARPSPCLKAAPCGGDSGLPTGPSHVAGVKAAALVAAWLLRPLDAGRHPIPTHSCAPLPRRASRLDRPPEPPALA